MNSPKPLCIKTGHGLSIDIISIYNENITVIINSIVILKTLTLYDQIEAKITIGKLIQARFTDK